MKILRYNGVLLFDFTLPSTSFKIVFDASLIYAINGTHMENFCFTEFSTKIHWNTRLAASDVFHMFTQSIKFF